MKENYLGYSNIETSLLVQEIQLFEHLYGFLHFWRVMMTSFCYYSNCCQFFVIFVNLSWHTNYIPSFKSLPFLVLEIIWGDFFIPPCNIRVCQTPWQIGLRFRSLRSLVYNHRQKYWDFLWFWANFRNHKWRLSSFILVWNYRHSCRTFIS